ncbi:Ethylene-responsive transcription factor ERF020, partial [Mucuna pruriens]
MSWSSNSSSALHGTSRGRDKKLKGVRRRKWGKWVSEIRVPGTQERLWLGTYATAEAAAVAHDVAVYCLRRPSSFDKLNFPDTLSSYALELRDMSPRSVQKVASDVGMDVDARNIIASKTSTPQPVTYDTQKNIDGHDRLCVSTVHSDLLCWDGLGNDDCSTWQASAADSTQMDQPLSISIEDYL